MNFTKEYSSAMLQYQFITNIWGNEHPAARKAWLKAFSLAPQQLQDEVTELYKDMGLIPNADGYLDNGEPIYTIESFAKCNGLTLEQAKQQLEQVQQFQKELGLPVDHPIDPSHVNLKQ